MSFLFRPRQGDNPWGKERLLLANALANQFIFVVDGAEEGRITSGRNGVPRAVTEKP
jgi:hypothetical protein